jgi:hypothetical protein
MPNSTQAVENAINRIAKEGIKPHTPNRTYYLGAKRFLRYVDMPNDDDCWTWKGGHSNEGRGSYTYNNRRLGAHRFMYELVTGVPLSTRVSVIPTCGTEDCVNPDHLVAHNIGKRKASEPDIYTPCLEAQVVDDWEPNAIPRLRPPAAPTPTPTATAEQDDPLASLVMERGYMQHSPQPQQQSLDNPTDRE